MIGQSDHVFRLQCRGNGVHLCYTPMYVASNVVAGQYDDELFITPPLDESDAVARESDRPLICQLAGDDTDEMVVAALRVQQSFDAIDINLGCPQRCAEVGNYGSFLLQRNPDKVLEILRALVAALDIPVTVKLRKLPGDISHTIAMALRLQEAGASALCLHGRFNHQREHQGPADWVAIRELKHALRIPVIANGSIQSGQDALDCLAYTGADAVMSSTGLLRNPDLFAELTCCYTGHTAAVPVGTVTQTAASGSGENPRTLPPQPPLLAPIPVVPSIPPLLAPIPVVPPQPPLLAPIHVVPSIPPLLAPIPVVPPQPPLLAPIHVVPSISSTPAGAAADVGIQVIKRAIKSCREYLLIAEERWVYPGSVSTNGYTASNVVRNHLFAVLQEHLMDKHRDLWSLLGCSEVVSVRQFKALIDLYEHRAATGSTVGACGRVCGDVNNNYIVPSDARDASDASATTEATVTAYTRKDAASNGGGVFLSVSGGNAPTTEVTACTRNDTACNGGGESSTVNGGNAPNTEVNVAGMTGAKTAIYSMKQIKHSLFYVDDNV